MTQTKQSARSLRTVCAACATLLLARGVALGQHQGDVWIGVNTSGQLAASSNGFLPDANYAMLLPVNGIIKGWSNDDPGFDHVLAGTDLQPLASGAQIWLEVVAVDPAFQAIDDGFQFLNEPGEDTLLGGSTVHEHITWHINNQDPAFDPEQCVWHATFVLRDDGSTGYATSEPFTLNFTSADVRANGVPADGDFDNDGGIDADDLAALAACMDGGGPEHVPDPYEPGVTTCEVECLNAFDFDDDRDVDLSDFAAFQRLLGE
ncbi:MAG: hypothetical protein H6817_06925 [Phycisphaerales bacterium]|nr:hypothetical protein [Phycisphaerales bacterium]